MSLPVTRLGVDRCGGECGNSPNTAATASPNVYANGIEVVRKTDTYNAHPVVDPHAGRTVTGGSATVFANGLNLARISDAISCTAKIAEGSPNVFAGG